MSRIDGLSVQGIRSFAPDHRENLSLSTPLTLIVGCNGSGKTTIIECLKYATTGDLPPNSKNGAFIHDPKLCNEKVVLANVGIKFRSIRGEPQVLYRKLQITVAKSGKSAFKTLESSLKGNRTESTRAKDTDEQVSELLGVSPAILDNVIFCHQDESLWPMSEPGTLKKKFDQIFEAQKYTKLVDYLKLTRKRRGELLRINQVTLKEDENTMNMAKANSKAIELLEAEVNQLDQECKELEERMAALEHKREVKLEEANVFLGMANHLTNLEDQLRYKNETVEALRDSITMMTESGVELRRLYEQSDARLGRLGEVINQDKHQFQGLEQESSSLRSKLNAKLADRGRLESDKEKYERQLQKRVEMIQQAATKHGIRGFGIDLDENQVRNFNDKIQAMFITKKKEHEKLEKELARITDEAASKISELEQKKYSLNSSRASAKEKKTENDHRIKRLQNEADSIDCDEGQIKILEKHTAALEASHQTTQNEFSQGGWDDKIRRIKSEQADLDYKRRELNTELVNCTRHSEQRAQLDVRKQELKDRESDLESLVGTYSGRISKIVRRDFNIESVASDYKSVLNEQTAIAQEEQRKCNVLSKELNQRDFELAEARNRQSASLGSKTKYEQSIVKALKKVVDGKEVETVTVDDFEAQYEDIEDSRLEAEKDLALFDKMKSFYEEAQTMLNTKNKCKLCERAFEDEHTKSRLLKRIAKGLDAQIKVKSEEDFEKFDKKFAKLSAVRADFDALQRLKDDMLRLKKEVDQAVEKRQDKLHELEAAEQIRIKAEEALSEVESVAKSVSEITQLHAKIQELKVETDRLQSQSQLSGSSGSASEIQEAQLVNSEQIIEASKNLDNLTRERQRILDQINHLALTLSEGKNKLDQARQQMNTKTSLFREIKTRKEDNQAQEEEIVRIDRELKGLQPRLESARGQRDVEIERGREKARVVAEERETIASTVNSLKLIEGDIQDYEDGGKAASLVSCERAIQGLHQKLDRLDSEMAKVSKRIRSQEKELGDGAHRKRNIEDNIKFRKGSQDLDDLQAQIDELRTHNAREDYERCKSDAAKFERERTRLTAQRDTKAGSMGAKDEALNERVKTHETLYKDAKKKFLENKIKVETSKAAIDDVATTSNVVDKAIMHFHSLKMEEINRIINELWRATYKGTDIDTIAIRSENETPSVNKTNTRKSYNYRVTMVKSDTEMDMRGRCSAGQKVLASIIIRLALAESFGVNCGLIALDEPTTNLDSENIKSLAASLHGIIKARQAQANFQLIVITHDEEFLRYMRCSEFCDYFYRVARDRDQKSTIREEDISRITE